MTLIVARCAPDGLFFLTDSAIRNEHTGRVRHERKGGMLPSIRAALAVSGDFRLQALTERAATSTAWCVPPYTDLEGFVEHLPGLLAGCWTELDARGNLGNVCSDPTRDASYSSVMLFGFDRAGIAGWWQLNSPEFTAVRLAHGCFVMPVPEHDRRVSQRFDTVAEALRVAWRARDLLRARIGGELWCTYITADVYDSRVVDVFPDAG